MLSFALRRPAYSGSDFVGDKAIILQGPTPLSPVIDENESSAQNLLLKGAVGDVNDLAAHF